ncbi:MAG: hypothetical protein ACK4N4_14240 [Burkholderiales bacterium]
MFTERHDRLPRTFRGDEFKSPHYFLLTIDVLLLHSRRNLLCVPPRAQRDLRCAHYRGPAGDLWKKNGFF